ncbi:hypothetical protein [Streptomyces sp. NBC_01803]|uniref:hypothetical protein n=1 Tax=Streptomyces sp. NBC_01803 TaxID=2975946 RepID=UPI002DDB55BD|nr:hypothetical protein [Streptomyces sp. NBC_01803]WSA46335.1 hypothetical protein OIE51_20385 [Streptomyces sp. NBC_01803]
MTVPTQRETLYDKQISLVGPMDIVGAHLVSSSSEREYLVRISYDAHAVEHTAWNLFDALVQVRRDLERESLRPAVEGACRNVYPSRMAREMGGGRRAYKWSGGGRPATVDIFDEVPAKEHDRLVYPEEQLAWFQEWRSRSR